MKRILIALLMGLSLVTPAVVSAAPDPIGCTGYPEARAFTSGQTWWRTTAGKTGTDFGHVHVEGCLPHEQRVSGTLTLDLRVIMHDSHGATFDRTEPVAKTNTEELTLGTVTTCRGLTNTTGTTECWERLTIDTTRFDKDGRNELRIRSWAKTPDGHLMHVSINILLDVRNGKTVSALTRLPNERAKGWYGGGSLDRVGYCEARFITKLPTAPVAGLWSVSVAWPNHDASIPITHHTAALDADAHAVPPNPGTVLVSAAGPGTATLAIDTTKLSDGLHKLSLRSDCDDASGSTNSGVGIITFRVANGAPTPTPTATPLPTPVPTPKPTPVPTPAPSTCG